MYVYESKLGFGTQQKFSFQLLPNYSIWVWLFIFSPICSYCEWQKNWETRNL